MIAIPGELSILNCGEGDMKLTFDSDDPLEVARAQRVVEDMLKRGYLLFVDEGDGNLKRVKRFNKATNCYVIADGALYAGDTHQAATQASEETVTPKKAGRPKKSLEREVPAGKAKTTAVARTAGG